MFPLAFIFLLGVAQNLLGDAMEGDDSNISSREQRVLRFCSPWDSCVEERHDDSPGIKQPYTCSCGSQCFKLGTCCIDSPYRVNSPPTHKCNAPVDINSLPYVPDDDGAGYAMVHRCPDNTESNSMWKDLCEEEWDEEDDIVKLAPVTSLDTSTTYVNYYCFRCHETTHNVLYWNLNLTGRYTGSKKLPESRDFDVAYSENSRRWIATFRDKDISFAVDLFFIAPEKLPFSLIKCDPFVISKCSGSRRYEDAQDKCNSYTAIVYGKCGKYRNVHCALCNGESLNNIVCNRNETHGVCATGFGGGMGGGGSGTGGYRPNIRHIMDVNLSGGNKVSCAEGEFWNAYLKKCKKIRCVIEGYVPKGGKCAPA